MGSRSPRIPWWRGRDRARSWRQQSPGDQDRRYAIGIDGVEMRCRRVIGADGAPGIAKEVDLPAVVPCGNVRADATIPQGLWRDSGNQQCGEVDTVDLEGTDVYSSVGVLMERPRVQAALLPPDGAQDVGVDLVLSGRIIDAIRMSTDSEQARKADEGRTLEHRH